MKLFRHGAVGSERAGAVDARGVKRDISLLVPDITPDWLSPGETRGHRRDRSREISDCAGRRRASALRSATSASSSRSASITASTPPKPGMQIPKDPVVFNKAITCIQGPNDDVVWPEGSEKMDWEVELGLVIGTKAQRVSRESALAHVAGYCLANDVSERDWQANRSGQWVKGKSFDTFGPLGPWLVTTDELPDPQACRSRSRSTALSGRRATPSDMIFTGRGDRFAPQPVHDASTGRRDRHRHARRRRPRHEASAVPEARRRDGARRRRPRRPAADGRLKPAPA